METPENEKGSSEEDSSIEEGSQGEEIAPMKRIMPERTTRGKRYNE